jgi:hypothetical protein
VLPLCCLNCFDSLFLNTSGDVFAINIGMLSININIVCGESFWSKSGTTRGSTPANSSLVKVLQISNTSGKRKGKRYTSFICNRPRDWINWSANLRGCGFATLTSSSKLGKIFLRFSLSENPGSTLKRPFRNEAFSSLGLLAKLDGSRKLSVDIAKDEK